MAFTALAVQRVVSEARRILRDVRAASQRWTDTDYIEALNSSMFSAVRLSPTTAQRLINIPLIAGTRQTLSQLYVGIGEVTRNYDGSDYGTAIIPSSRDAMDASDMDWHNEVADAVVIHFIPTSHPEEFFVYPPQPAATTQEIEAMAVFRPVTLSTVDPAAVIASLVANTVFDEVHLIAFANYVAYHLLAGDSDAGNNVARAKLFYAQALMHLGVKEDET